MRGSTEENYVQKEATHATAADFWRRYRCTLDFKTRTAFINDLPGVETSEN